ncbi:nodulation protein D 1 [Roseobacter cerasinus]|uniref:Nodulation protein D 1 n=1 Tax=Roseobacter cerasinus TaxID=2602289 RepID=A0A640VKE3_9RHOB|nr:LysR family transcriptional regulator [Roseobacter cerasinus]GFE48908.1 nodulation protein D 1 [Roseobacter cerasinus]
MRLSGFNLNQLIGLEALLAEGNVTRAAKRAHLSQSAMSAVLSQLRLHFDDALLVRSGRGMVLTPFARSLIAPMNELLSQAQSFAALRPYADSETIDREVTIVASEFVLQTCVGPGIIASTREVPGLRFDLLPLSEDSGKLLRNGEVDLLLAGQSLDVGMPPKAELFSEGFVCLSCAERGPPQGQLTRQAFLERRHVVVKYIQHQMTHDDEEVLRREGLIRKRQITVWSYSLVPYVLCGTEMIATLPERAAHQISRRWPVQIHPFPFGHDPVRVFAYWHASRDTDAVIERFLARLS